MNEGVPNLCACGHKTCDGADWSQIYQDSGPPARHFCEGQVIIFLGEKEAQGGGI